MIRDRLTLMFLIVIVAQLSFLVYRELEEMSGPLDGKQVAADSTIASEDEDFSLSKSVPPSPFGVITPGHGAIQLGQAMGTVFDTMISGMENEDPLFGTKENRMRHEKSVHALGDPGTTEKEVRQYLDKLAELAGSTKGWSNPSPEADALRKLRSEDVPILLDYLDTSLAKYIQFAIEDLVVEEQKEIILAAFREHPEMRRAVEKFGWEAECSKLITQYMREAGTFEKEDWAQLAANTGDMQAYRALIDAYFEISSTFSNDRESVYRAAMQAPGFPLAEFHDRIWDGEGTRKIIDKEKVATLATRCISNGSANALIAAARTLNSNETSDGESRNIAMIKISLEAQVKKWVCEGDDLESKVKWVLENQDKIYFDTATLCFKRQETEPA